MTQKELITQYIITFGTITPMEAFEQLGITKLATRISELKQEGLPIRQKMMRGKNRFGKPVHYMEYSFEASDDEDQ